MTAQPKWSPKNGRYGGARPSPTPAMRRFLVFLQETGGWLADDPFRVSRATIESAERLGWAEVERFRDDGAPAAARITTLGRAAYAWGEASVHSPA